MGLYAAGADAGGISTGGYSSGLAAALVWLGRETSPPRQVLSLARRLEVRAAAAVAAAAATADLRRTSCRCRRRARPRATARAGRPRLAELVARRLRDEEAGDRPRRHGARESSGGLGTAATRRGRAVPPSAPGSTVTAPLSDRARSSIASKLARRRSPAPSSAITASTPPSRRSATGTETRVGGPRRIAWCERLADDLVERDLRVLGEVVGGLDVEVDLDLVRRSRAGRRAPGPRAEALVAEDDRLELEREVAQRADRLALPLERARSISLRLLDAPVLERGEPRRASARSRTATAPARRGGRARAGGAPPARP